MAKALPSRRSLIEGRAALIVIDIQASTFIDHSDMRAIDNMAGYTQRMELSRKAIDTARAHDIPVVFIQEVHRPDLIDFGRELDGDEDVHCLEGNPAPRSLQMRWGFCQPTFSSGNDAIRRSSVPISKYCCAD